jgi:hypothetical protein
MIRKALGLLAVAGIGAAVASQWRDIVRYAKIKQISGDKGDPSLVPAAGRSTYPAEPGKAGAGGHDDFDSASRGGPATG